MTCKRFGCYRSAGDFIGATEPGSCLSHFHFCIAKKPTSRDLCDGSVSKGTFVLSLSFSVTTEKNKLALYSVASYISNSHVTPTSSYHATLALAHVSLFPNIHSTGQPKNPLWKHSHPTGFRYFLSKQGYFKRLMENEIKVQVSFGAKNILKPMHIRGLQKFHDENEYNQKTTPGFHTFYTKTNFSLHPIFPKTF